MYFTAYPTRYSNLKGLALSGNVDDEIWALFEYYSEIDEVGKQFLLSKGVAKRKVDSTYELFQSYIRQAKTYYYSAKSLHYRSASLLYYYCFLNLAKAGLLVHKPSTVGMKLQHGLSFDVKKRFNNFEDVTIKTLDGSNSVFGLLYQAYFNETLPYKQLNAVKLFGYVSDVAAEYEQCGYGQPRFLSSVFTHVSNDADKTSWGIVGIRQGWEMAKYPKRFRDFNAEYQLIDLNKNLSKSLWDIDAMAHNKYRFYQKLQPDKWLSDQTPYPPHEAVQDMVKALNGTFQTDVYAITPRFFIALPYAATNQKLIDEVISIYTIMFYLGSLVRYKPDYLEKLLGKKESWLISSFTRSAPQTFLRGMLPWVIGIDYRYERR
jgi:hypothetical protein